MRPIAVLAAVTTSFALVAPLQAAQWRMDTGKYSKQNGVLHETFDDVSVDPREAIDVPWTWSGRRAPNFYDTNNAEFNCRLGDTLGFYMCSTGWVAKPSVVTFDLSATPVDYYGFRWQSIDPPNSVRIYSGDALIASVAGEDARAVMPDGRKRGYFEVFADPGKLITRVDLISAGRSFETDNHGFRFVTQQAAGVAAALVREVPEPSTYAMLGAGLGLVGWYARRRARG